MFLAHDSYLLGEVSCKGIHFNINVVDEYKSIKYNNIIDVLHFFTDVC